MKLHKGSIKNIRTPGQVIKRIPLLVLFFSTFFLSFSQNSNITGTVVEKGNTWKVANATVAIEGTAFLQATNDKGQFAFDQAVPEGKHLVMVTKEGYEVKYFLIDVIQGKKLVVDEVELTTTKKEKKRRKKLAKKEKKLKKDKKGFFGILGKKKAPEVVVVYEDLPKDSMEEEEPVEIFTSLQKKYAEIIGVEPEEITNTELYAFIDDWMGTPYLMGGETKTGIDCSSFMQRLFINVYGLEIERTAQRQKDSESTDTWSDPQFLQEGDFVFFRAVGEMSKSINHVGVYLGNNKFVNATSTVGKSGSSGVKISDLTDPYWMRRFFAAGRRVNTKG